MVFQSYALYPHKTVQANIEFPLKVRGDRTRRRGRRPPRRRPAMLGLTDYLGRKPGALSGGQRQRVALARAIVRKPAVFCMDEPLSNLDAKLRGETRAELIALHQRLALHVRLRHPRPGRGDDDGHPHRRDVERRAAAGRHAAGGLRRARRRRSSPRSSARRR